MYEFEIVKCEKNMKNYYDNGNTKGNDTIFITLKNIGKSEWESNKAKLICVEKESNLFFEDEVISEDVDTDDETEIFLKFKRNNKNSFYGNCKCTIQLIYDEEYYSQKRTFNFTKNFDMNGNIINQNNSDDDLDKKNKNNELAEISDNNDSDKENQNSKVIDDNNKNNEIIKASDNSEENSKNDFENLERNIKKENNSNHSSNKSIEINSKKNISNKNLNKIDDDSSDNIERSEFNGNENINSNKNLNKIDDDSSDNIERSKFNENENINSNKNNFNNNLNNQNQKNNNYKIDIDSNLENQFLIDDEDNNKLNDKNYIIKRFRAAYSISKENYSDEELEKALSNNQNNFERSFISLIELQEEKEKEKYNDPNVMKRLIYRFKEDFNLYDKKWTDSKIKKAIIKAKGNFEDAFEMIIEE